MLSSSEIRTYVYIDGNYVREEFRREGLPEDAFNPEGPALSTNIFPPRRTFYYDAIDEKAPPEERRQRRGYLNKIQRLPHTHVIEGRVRRTKREPREQKGVDVQLAIDALQAANRGIIDAILLVTGDADFEPLTKAVREVGPFVWVVALKHSLARALRLAADDVLALEGIPLEWVIPADEARDD